MLVSLEYRLIQHKLLVLIMHRTIVIRLAKKDIDVFTTLKLLFLAYLLFFSTLFIVNCCKSLSIISTCKHFTLTRKVHKYIIRQKKNVLLIRLPIKFYQISFFLTVFPGPLASGCICVEILLNKKSFAVQLLDVCFNSTMRNLQVRTHSSGPSIFLKPSY